MKNALFQRARGSRQLRARAKFAHASLYAAYLGIVASVVTSPCNSLAQALVENPWDAKLKPYIQRLNTKLPTMVAPTLRQERISVFNGVINHSYTETSRTAAELMAMNLAETQRPHIFPSICKAPDTGRMLREGISFRYLYYGKDGKLAAQLIFMPVDCASVR